MRLKLKFQGRKLEIGSKKNIKLNKSSSWGSYLVSSADNTLIWVCFYLGYLTVPNLWRITTKWIDDTLFMNEKMIN